MFTPTHLLPLYSPSERKKYEGRWESTEGRKLKDRILAMIRAGGGEDFLEQLWDEEPQVFLDDSRDLKGLNIFEENIDFPSTDNFEAIDFSYARLLHCKFRNAAFYCHFAFAKVYNCEFIDCFFNLNSFYGSNIEKAKFVNCDFIQYSIFTNCNFSEVEFTNCFVPDNIFIDCKFDEATQVSNPIEKPIHKAAQSFSFDNKKLASVFRGLKEAYAEGGATEQSRSYYFRQMQAVTRHNTAKRFRKLVGYFWEFIGGYGVRPLRVLIAMCSVFFLGLVVFCAEVGFSDGFLLTSGALFTFGARAELLEHLSIFYKALFAFCAFSGIFLVALLVTVLANRWLRER